MSIGRIEGPCRAFSYISSKAVDIKCCANMIRTLQVHVLLIQNSKDLNHKYGQLTRWSDYNANNTYIAASSALTNILTGIRTRAHGRDT